MIDKKYIKHLLGIANPYIFDIGSYDLSESWEFKHLLPGASIEAFDPFPQWDEIEAKDGDAFCDPEGIRTHHFALSDTDSVRPFYVASGHSQSSSIALPGSHTEVFKDILFDQKREVPCRRLDSWYDEKGGGKTIDLVWADVNGHEKALITGGAETFKNKVRYFYTEYSSTGLYLGQASLADLKYLLPDYEVLYSEYYYDQQFGNVLLKNKKFN